MGKKGSTGASAGRLGGRLAAGKKLKNKLKRLPAVKVINKAEKKRRKKRKEQTAAAAAAQVVSASLMAIADSIADALNLTPSHKDLVLLGASAAYTAHQAIVQEAASVSGSTAAAGPQQQQPPQAQKTFSTPAEDRPLPHSKTRASSALVTELQATKKQRQKQADAAPSADTARHSEGMGSSSDPLPLVLGKGRRGEQLVV